MTVQSYYERQCACFEHNRPIVRQALLDLGCKTVICAYEGYGDEGSLELPKFEPGFEGSPTVKNIIFCGWSKEEPGANSQDIEEATQNIFYDCLDSLHGGWENNDGARGDIEWDLQEDTINISHCAYFTDYLHTASEL